MTKNASDDVTIAGDSLTFAAGTVNVMSNGIVELAATGLNLNTGRGTLIQFR